VRDGKAEIGIVLGGSGQGEQIAANKVHGVRAALCNDLYLAEMARSHNNANVLSMGGRVVSAQLAEQIVDKFLSTEFEGGRHERRVAQLSEIEKSESSLKKGA
jgi:ribose 5-phosphate isomerase B